MRAFLFVSFLLISFQTLAGEIVFKLSRSENLRILKNEILEILEVLPAGTSVSVPEGISPETHLFRTGQGNIERSSNGFLPQVKILAGELPPERILELNRLNGWITVTAVPLQTTADFPGLRLTEPREEYLKSFEGNGRPRFNFSSYYQKRFKGSLNLAVAPDDQSEEERTKWRSIMSELAKAGERTVPTKSHYLFMSVKDALEASIAYEDKDEVLELGAWTIAVKATAVRHGFPNVPCAEFMSEMIKQAYKRAGYDVFEDFNRADGTHLIWSKTSAVVNLANTLHKAGWIPWELAIYRPPTGAIMAHFKATTPGHVYMAAGHDGRVILDNGSPAGRLLFNTSDKVIKMMYYGGVFFLPPGIRPALWNE